MDARVTPITGTRKHIGRFPAGHYARCGHQVIGRNPGKPDGSLAGHRHFDFDVTDEKAVCAMPSPVRRESDRVALTRNSIP